MRPVRADAPAVVSHITSNPDQPLTSTVSPEVENQVPTQTHGARMVIVLRLGTVTLRLVWSASRPYTGRRPL